jgi:hypothetical protein
MIEVEVTTDMQPDVGGFYAGPWQVVSLDEVVRRLLPATGQRPNRPWTVEARRRLLARDGN